MTPVYEYTIAIALHLITVQELDGFEACLNLICSSYDFQPSELRFSPNLIVCIYFNNSVYVSGCALHYKSISIMDASVHNSMLVIFICVCFGCTSSSPSMNEFFCVLSKLTRELTSNVARYMYSPETIVCLTVYVT